MSGRGDRFGDAQRQRVVGDLPRQQLVVRLDERVRVVLHADGALEPPVGTVQAVRVRRAGDREAGVA